MTFSDILARHPDQKLLRPGGGVARLQIVLWNAALMSIVLTFIFASIAFGARIADLRHRQENITTKNTMLILDMIRLEGELGYGGFIHNYKNAVLRPGEPRNIEKAEENLERALRLLRRIELAVRGDEIPITIEGLRQTLHTYSDRLITLKQEDITALGARELDLLLRVNDMKALDDLSQLITTIAEQALVKTADISDGIQTLSNFAAAIGTALLAAGFVIARERYNFARKALSARVTQYFGMLETLPQGVIGLSAEGRIVSLNQTARALLAAPALALPANWPRGAVLLACDEPASASASPFGSVGESDLVTLALRGVSFERKPALLRFAEGERPRPVRLTTWCCDRFEDHPAALLLILEPGNCRRRRHRKADASAVSGWRRRPSASPRRASGPAAAAAFGPWRA
ncbi:hypothetical protein [Rhodobacteraceae bacterium DSL-40]|uniref:hypothetical protein n=1 Tax=Amaricoccus sp. B4 TaxID=3368557 RepID=UPI000DABDF06